MPTPARWACTASWKARPRNRVWRTCPPADVQLVKDTLAAALAGEFTRFDVFKGPINDNQGQRDPGRRRVAGTGSTWTVRRNSARPASTCMYWWADGITAELPDPTSLSD